MAPSRHILLIENDADVSDALRALLEVWGHRVSCARTGPHGVEIALLDALDVIVLHLGLSDLDGCEVIRRIRAGRRDAPWIIAYSGYHERRIQARAAGCDAFVLKPRLEELQASINSLGARAYRPRRHRRSAKAASGGRDVA